MFQFMFRRWALLRLALLVFAGLSGSSQLAAQPTLTTVQDTIYLADGKSFNGLLLIDWRSFDTANGTVIGQSSKVVQVLNGFLRVQLAPTTANNTTYYSVKYVSRGVVLFSEVWSVPVTGATLRLRDVRAALLPGGFVSGPAVPGNTNPPPIIGNVLGTGTFVDNEVLTVPSSGSTSIFTLSQTPNPASTLLLYRNGLLQSEVVDYTISGRTISFLTASAPLVGDTLRASYRTGTISNSAHNLLSPDHTDTLAENVQRGDLLVGQSTSTLGLFQWRRLPLTANRCLVSNTLDAVWGSCLVTSMSSGRIPFANGSVLTEAANSLFWNNSSRRFGVGTETPSTTLHVQDAASGGVTGLVLQAGSSQGSNPLSRWLNGAGTELARLNSDGALTAPRVEARTTTSRAAWRDEGVPLGTPSDPTQLANGDFWFSAGQRARKTFEAGQMHSVPQVVCSSSGPTSAPPAQNVTANCFVPAGYFDSGDRLEVAINARHEGTASQFRVEMCIPLCNGQGTAASTNTFFTNDFSASVPLVFARGSGGLGTRPRVGGGQDESIAWGIQYAPAPVPGLASDIITSFTTGFSIGFRLTLLSAGTQDTLNLRNFSVIRYPAQSNPVP